MGLEEEIKDWSADVSVNQDGTFDIQWSNKKRDLVLAKIRNVEPRWLPMACAGMVGEVRQACGVTALV